MKRTEGGRLEASRDCPLTTIELEWVLDTTHSQSLREATKVQSLWGGCGELLRLKLEGDRCSSVILKRVVPPPMVSDSYSDRRKRRSYEVERAWYAGPAAKCTHLCRVATCLGMAQFGETSLLLLEDLAQSGYQPARPPSPCQMKFGLEWLAEFHASFLGFQSEELWEQGTYWHLATRPEEWERMTPGQLKVEAHSIDRRLRESSFQTLVHGDSKPANFLFGPADAAAVDFQYVGPGCGVRDVAYFLDCCLGEIGCLKEAEEWLDYYFKKLAESLQRRKQDSIVAPLQAEWRSLFPVAWCDYQRFWQGWQRPTPPGPFSQKMLAAL